MILNEDCATMTRREYVKYICSFVHLFNYYYYIASNKSDIKNEK